MSWRRRTRSFRNHRRERRRRRRIKSPDSYRMRCDIKRTGGEGAGEGAGVGDNAHDSHRRRY